MEVVLNYKKEEIGEDAPVRCIFVYVYFSHLLGVSCIFTPVHVTICCGLWPPGNTTCLFLTWYQSNRLAPLLAAAAAARPGLLLPRPAAAAASLRFPGSSSPFVVVCPRPFVVVSAPVRSGDLLDASQDRLGSISIDRFCRSIPQIPSPGTGPTRRQASARSGLVLRPLRPRPQLAPPVARPPPCRSRRQGLVPARPLARTRRQLPLPGSTPAAPTRLHPIPPSVAGKGCRRRELACAAGNRPVVLGIDRFLQDIVVQFQFV
jgi:hypothetical protein